MSIFNIMNSVMEISRILETDLKVRPVARVNEKLRGNKISIVLPCYNEAKTILQVIEKINALNFEKYEIVVVDDGSTDDSVALLKNIPYVKTYVHKKNYGYGQTLIDGIRKTTGDLIVTIDSDGQHDPLDIPYLCEIVSNGEADIVVGSRYVGNYYYQIPFVNRVGEALIEILMKIFFGKSVKNNQGGLRIFHRKTIDIFTDIKFSGMIFTTELLIKSFLHGYKVVEGPINLIDRPVGNSRVKKIKLLVNLFQCFTYYLFQKIHTYK